MRRLRLGLVLALALVLIAPAATEAARQFNGTSDNLISASAIDLTPYQAITLAMWLWWDTFANNDNMALEGGTNFVAANSIVVDPNNAAGTAFMFGLSGNAGQNTRTFTRPSSGVWHHYVFTLDRSLASNEANTAYVDGVLQALNAQNNSNNSDFMSSATLSLMARNASSLFGAGRIAEMAIWGGLVFSQADVNSLYNSGAGALATDVQVGSLAFYWRILGAASPEPATVGGVNLTVNGTTSVAHPFTTAVAPATHKPRDLRKGRTR